MLGVTLFIASWSFFFSGAWWEKERKASVCALLFAVFMILIGVTA